MKEVGIKIRVHNVPHTIHYDYKVRPTNKVFKLYRKISRFGFRTDPKEQKLWFKGEQLKPYETIEKAGLVDGSEVALYDPEKTDPQSLQQNVEEESVEDDYDGQMEFKNLEENLKTDKEGNPALGKNAKKKLRRKLE